MHGNINVKFTYTIFTTEEPHDTKAGKYHSIALFNKAHKIKNSCILDVENLLILVQFLLEGWILQSVLIDSNKCSSDRRVTAGARCM
jgi:hypothetical protein